MPQTRLQESKVSAGWFSCNVITDVVSLEVLPVMYSLAVSSKEHCEDIGQQGLLNETRLSVGYPT